MTKQKEGSSSNLPDEDYEPYDERYIKKPLKNWEAYNLIVRGCLGSGLLYLPKAFKFSGILVGILELVMLSIFVTYMFHVLTKSRYTLCKILRVGRLWYPEAMKAAFKIGPGCLRIFSSIIGIYVDLFILIHQLIFLCSYISYMSHDLKRIFEEYHGHNFPVVSFILMLGPYLLIIMCVNNIKVYAVFAVISNVVSLAALVLMVLYLIVDLPNFTLVPAYSSPENNILFIIPTLMALQSLPVISTVELNMLHGRDFLKPRGILCQTYATLTIIYLVIAVLGYWRFEERISGFLTENLHTSSRIVQVSIIAYFFGVYITYGLQGLIGVNVIWEHYFSKLIRTNEFIKGIIEYVFRFILFVGLPMLYTIYLPTDFGVIFLIQGVCMAHLLVIFPALLEICILWPRKEFGSCNYIFVKNMLLVIFGIALLAISGFHGYRVFSGHKTLSGWW